MAHQRPVHFSPQVLSALCRPFAKASDTILALHEMTRERPAHPGECIRCFYRLKGTQPREATDALAHFHGWLERHVEIQIKVDDTPRGTMPLFLEGASLEDFCERTMARVREDRVEQAPEVLLELSFREEAA